MQKPCEGSNGAFGYALDRRFGRGDAQATCDVPEWGFRRVLEVPRETRPGEATPCGGLAARPRSRRRIATPESFLEYPCQEGVPSSSLSRCLVPMYRVNIFPGALNLIACPWPKSRALVFVNGQFFKESRPESAKRIQVDIPLLE